MEIRPVTASEIAANVMTAARVREGTLRARRLDLEDERSKDEARLGVSAAVTGGGHVNARRLRRVASSHVRALVRAAIPLIIGYDLSRYDELEAVDSAAFVIVNVDDPGLADKLRRAIAQGKPWGGYKWIYTGASGRAAAQECVSKLRRFGEPPLGSWADYEEAGNTHQQLVDWFGGLDSVGARGGYYTNDWRVDHAALIRDVGTRWYWTAGYPGANDGRFPGWQYLRTSRPAQLWQFTSTNGTRDQNAVVDLAWYQSLGGGAGGGGLFNMLSESEEREILDFVRLAREGAPQFGVPKLLPTIAQIDANTRPAPEFGVPQVAVGVAKIMHDLEGKVPLVEGKPTLRALLELAAGEEVELPEGGLSDAEKAELRDRAAALRAAADSLDALAGR
jgi:hypothetical protein